MSDRIYNRDNPQHTHDHAANELDRQAAGIQGERQNLISAAQRKHDDAQRAMDEVSNQVNSTHKSQLDDISGAPRKRSSSKGRANSKGRSNSKGRPPSRERSKGRASSKTRTSTTAAGLAETSKLDQLRAEQNRRFEQFNSEVNMASRAYDQPYGTTSFGTPVNKDKPKQAPGFTAHYENTVPAYTAPGGLKETEQLDRLREKQSAGFAAFSNSLNTSHVDYGSKYGKTSMGTPVHRDNQVAPLPHTSIYTVDHVDHTVPIDLNRFLAVLNDIRAKPAYYADRVKLIYFKPDGKHVNHFHEPDFTEGSRVYTDGYEFLKMVRPLGPLRLDPGLTAVAYDQAMFLCSVNRLGNEGPNRETTADRMSRYGTLMSGNVAENSIKSRELSYEVTILNMIIDDGVPGRGRRMNIFSPEFTKVGLAAAKHNMDSAYFIDIVFAGEGYVSNTHSISAQTRNLSGLEMWEYNNRRP